MSTVIRVLALVEGACSESFRLVVLSMLVTFIVIRKGRDHFVDSENFLRRASFLSQMKDVWLQLDMQSHAKH